MPILKSQLTDIIIDEVDSFVINFQGSLGIDETFFGIILLVKPEVLGLKI